MRKRHRDSWKQAAHLFSFDDALDADGHGCSTMRNLMFFRASDYLRKRVLKDAEKFVGDFAFRPQKRLQTLDPLEVGNDHAAGVAQNIGNHEISHPIVARE